MPAQDAVDMNPGARHDWIVPGTTLWSPTTTLRFYGDGAAEYAQFDAICDGNPHPSDNEWAQMFNGLNNLDDGDVRPPVYTDADDNRYIIQYRCRPNDTQCENYGSAQEAFVDPVPVGSTCGEQLAWDERGEPLTEVHNLPTAVARVDQCITAMDMVEVADACVGVTAFAALISRGESLNGRGRVFLTCLAVGAGWQRVYGFSRCADTVHGGLPHERPDLYQDPHNRVGVRYDSSRGGHRNLSNYDHHGREYVISDDVVALDFGEDDEIEVLEIEGVPVFLDESGGLHHELADELGDDLGRIGEHLQDFEEWRTTAPCFIGHTGTNACNGCDGDAAATCNAAGADECVSVPKLPLRNDEFTPVCYWRSSNSCPADSGIWTSQDDDWTRQYDIVFTQGDACVSAASNH